MGSEFKLGRPLHEECTMTALQWMHNFEFIVPSTEMATTATIDRFAVIYFESPRRMASVWSPLGDSKEGLGEPTLLLRIWVLKAASEPVRGQWACRRAERWTVGLTEERGGLTEERREEELLSKSPLIAGGGTNHSDLLLINNPSRPGGKCWHAEDRSCLRLVSDTLKSARVVLVKPNFTDYNSHIIGF